MTTPYAAGLPQSLGFLRAQLTNPWAFASAVVRKYDIGKGYSVSVLWRGGEVDTIYGFEREHDALEWIRENSQAWLLENR
jgi:hypothetical protein